VPATPVGTHLLTWDEDEAIAAAQDRLQAVLERLRGLGAEAEGEIGNRDPLIAIDDAILTRRVDEIILSTLPESRSRWLRQDVPSKLRAAVDVPIEVVSAPREAEDTSSG